MDKKEIKSYKVVNGEFLEVSDEIKDAKLSFGEYMNASWDSHYKNETEVSQWAMSFVKETYSGRGNYIPWSIMVIVLKKLDFYSTVEVLLNDEGGMVFSYGIDKPTKNYRREMSLETDNEKGTVSKEKIVDQDIVTRAYAHFVKVKVVYQGMEHIEEYPILDNAHQPTDNLDSALVNKNLQRAKARAISTVTGVGFSLWTLEDIADHSGEEALKEEQPKPKTKPKTKTKSKEEKPVEKTMDLNATLSVDGKELPIHEEVARFIQVNKDNEKMKSKLKQMIPTIEKLSGMVFGDITTEEDMADMFSKVDNLEGLYKVLRSSL